MQSVILDPYFRDVVRQLENSIRVSNLDLNNIKENGWVNCDLELDGRKYVYRTLYTPEEGYSRELTTADGARIWATIYPDSTALHPCYAPALRTQPFLPAMGIEERLSVFQDMIDDGMINNISGHQGQGWCVFQLEAGMLVDPVYMRCKPGANHYYLVTIVQSKTTPDKTEWLTRRCQWLGHVPIKRRGSLCRWCW